VPRLMIGLCMGNGGSDSMNPAISFSSGEKKELASSAQLRGANLRLPWRIYSDEGRLQFSEEP